MKQTQRQTRVFNENPPNSFIWPYSFDWPLRVVKCMWLHFKRPGVVAAALLCLLALQAFNHARPVETLTDIPDIWTDRYAYHDSSLDL